MTSITLVRAGGEHVPIACSLTSAQYGDRTAALSDLATRAMTSRERIEGGDRLAFADTPAVERELRRVVVAETACCPFLRMDLRREDEALVLDITGPPDARAIIAALFGPARSEQTG